MSDFFTVMQPKIAEAFYKKFDAAALLNTDNPFPQSLEESVVAADNVIKGPLTYDNILALEDALSENEFEPNAFISNRKTVQNFALQPKQLARMLNSFTIVQPILLMACQ